MTAYQKLAETSDTESEIEELPDNGLRANCNSFIESIQLYQADNLHPVHLGDLFGGRYRVLHKLGQGGFATIWLCRDLKAGTKTPYVAAKVIAADASGHDCPELNIQKIAKHVGPSHNDILALPQKILRVKGPNGHHLILIYQVIGPQVTAVHEHDLKIHHRRSLLKKYCYQSTRALALLHESGYCHGDFKPSNILIHTHGLNALTSKQIIEKFGKPGCEPVTTKSGRAHRKKSAPQYLVHPASWFWLASDQHVTLSQSIVLTDFGQSFKIADTHPLVGTPIQYCPPEYILDDIAGVNTDLWALGCTLYEIWTGWVLFGNMFGDDDEQLDSIVTCLGPLPEPWWSQKWKRRRDFFHDEPDSNGRAIIVIRPGEDPIPTSRPDPSIRRKVEQGYRQELCDADEKSSAALRKDLDLLADLLCKLLRYDYTKRISGREALEHPWFHTHTGSCQDI